MKKRIVVEKASFDAALSRLLKAKPIAREKVKTARKKPAKIIPPKE